MRRAVAWSAVGASYVLLIGFMAVLVIALTTAIADGWALRQAALRHEDASPRFSPDGTRIAWLRRDEDGSQLWVMSADGSGQQPLAEATRFRWAAGGESLLVSRGGPRVFLVGLDGAPAVAAGRTRLARGPVRDRHRGRVVFVRDDRLVLRLPGGAELPLT